MTNTSPERPEQRVEAVVDPSESRAASRHAREGMRGTRLGQERGIALILVLTMMVLFTAYVADFTYESRVRYTLASHARDEIKAQIMAENGIRQFQMLLEFEQQFIKDIGAEKVAALLPWLGLSTNQSLIVQMTHSMPLPCNAIAMLSGGGLGGGSEGDGEASGEGEAAAEAAAASEGDCSVKAEAEATKLYSLKGLGKNTLGLKDLGGKLERLVALFESEDFKEELRAANITPEELAGNICDWMDMDTARYNGQGYEDNLYNRGEDPYLPKNRDFDSVAELRLVAGMTDGIFAKLAKHVTIYEDRFILAEPDPDRLVYMVVYLTNGRWHNTLENRQALWKAYQESYKDNIPPKPPSTRLEFEEAMGNVPGGVLAMLDPEKMNRLLGPAVSPNGNNNKQLNMPKLYSITAKAQVGDVSKSIRVVLNMGSTPASYLYWRED